MKKILLFMMFLIFGNAYAFESHILIRTLEVDNALEIIQIKVIRENPYYYTDYYSSLPESEKLSYLFTFYDEQGRILKQEYAHYTTHTLIRNTDELSLTKKISVSLNGNPLSERDINFCNYNGICEPCILPDCINQENELTCPDCAQSSGDGFCNVHDDGICDPDCVDAYSLQPEHDKKCIEDYFLGWNCDDYGGMTCGIREICLGKERFIAETQEHCCMGVCEIGTITISEEENTELTGVDRDSNSFVLSILLFLFIFSIVSLIFFLLRKRISLIFLLGAIVFFVFLIFTFQGMQIITQDKITGKVISVDDQKRTVCEVARDYNIPGELLLTIAYKESRINHWRESGELKISGDGGVGIMQITKTGYSKEKLLSMLPGPIENCGNSLLDNRRLDITKLRDNIECGVKTLKDKCEFVKKLTGNLVDADCTKGEVHYCCPSNHPGNFRDTRGNYFPISLNGCQGNPVSHSVYRGYDLAIRGFNGWGCSSSNYNDPLVDAKIRSYVEDYHKDIEKFKGYCESIGVQAGKIPETDYTPAYTIAEIGISPDLMSGKVMGYYYLNPSSKAKAEFDFGIYDELASDAGLFFKGVESCIINEVSSRGGNLDFNEIREYCISEYLPTLCRSKTCLISNNLIEVDYDTGYSFYRYTDGYFKETPVVIKFALEIP